MKLFNLERWISMDGKEAKQETLAYQVPYGMAKGLKDRAEIGRHLPGTFFKIIENSPITTLQS